MEDRSAPLFIEADTIPNESLDDGVTRRILAHDPELMMTHVTFKSGALGPVHRHPHRQVTYIERGKFEVLIGNQRRTMKSGDCFFIPPDVDHGTVALEDGALIDVFAPARQEFLEPRP